MEKVSQHLKAIPYQDLLDLQNSVERLHSWQQPLAVLDNFFMYRTGNINKKQIVKEYYASAHLFHAFYMEFNRLMECEERRWRRSGKDGK
ncbi:hypothetical protein [Enterococcus rivorum]|uniref:hypothetical protein n=1 Tax=Enterococcus rivorum TaxID=762845 RepID=UPI00363BDFC3